MLNKIDFYICKNIYVDCEDCRYEKDCYKDYLEWRKLNKKRTKNALR